MRFDVLRRTAKNILDLEGVVGIGSSKDVKIFVESEKYIDAVPMSLAGKPVKVVVTGRLRALGLSIAERRGKVRPLVGGISISNEYTTAGTLGIVHNGHILTNAHVIAMDMEGNFVKSAKVIQPGVYDHGDPEKDVVGELLGYAKIWFNDVTAENYADLAVAVATADYVNNVVAGEAEDYQVVMTPYEPREGEEVRKTGRTTGTTYGTVESTSAVVKVWYSDDKWAAFHDVILVKGNPFSKGGDSGSVVDKDGQFVGLVFAGNEVTGYGVVCKAKHVLYAFKELTQPTEVEEKPSLLPVMTFMLPLGLMFTAARKKRF